MRESSRWTPESIKALRNRLGLSQSGLARTLDSRCTVTTVANWEQGVNKPSLFYSGRLFAIAEELQNA